MSEAVKVILQQIDRLPEQDRHELEMCLARRTDEEWEGVLAEGQRIAREKGLGQESIQGYVDSVIHKRRYGT